MRRFGALATVLRRNLFRHAKLRLTIFYVAVLLATLFAADAITNYTTTLRVEQNVEAEIQDSRIKGQIRDIIGSTLSRAQGIDYTIYFLLAGIVAGISYFLAGRTLEPINRVMDSQRRFLANASHELRTPLSVMKTDCEVALKETDHIPDEELRRILKSNIEEIDRMTGIINNLLLISHGENESARIPFMPVNLSEVVVRIRAPLEALAAEHGVSLSVSTIPSAPVMGNLIALEEIALNCAKNAIIYTPQGGTITIAIQKNKKNVELIVRDTGIGIKRSDLPNIVDPFFKSRNAKKFDSRGYGLGLSIVHEIVKLHGGSIRVASAPNQGTTIRIVLPAA